MHSLCMGMVKVSIDNNCRITLYKPIQKLYNKKLKTDEFQIKCFCTAGFQRPNTKYRL